MCSSRKGLLLIEAVLSAVIISTGLVVISRGLAGQLRALSSVERYETLRQLARARLAELEADLLAGRLSSAKTGAFSPPSDAYRWEVTATPRTDAGGNSTVTDVVLAVARDEDGSPGFQVATVWPTAWLPAEWQ